MHIVSIAVQVYRTWWHRKCSSCFSSWTSMRPCSKARPTRTSSMGSTSISKSNRSPSNICNVKTPSSGGYSRNLEMLFLNLHNSVELLWYQQRHKINSLADQLFISILQVELGFLLQGHIISHLHCLRVTPLTGDNLKWLEPRVSWKSGISMMNVNKSLLLFGVHFSLTGKLAITLKKQNPLLGTFCWHSFSYLMRCELHSAL